MEVVWLERVKKCKITPSAGSEPGLPNDTQLSAQIYCGSGFILQVLHLHELDYMSQNPRSLLQDSTLESPPLFPARVLGMEALWQRDTLDQTVLRQQHPFVFEAGDPRGVRCKSEEHSSCLNVFYYLLLSLPRVPSVSALSEIHHTLRYAVFPALPVTLQTAGFSFQPPKKSSHFGALCS